MPHVLKSVPKEATEQRYYDVRCDGCNKELEPAFPVEPDGGWRYLQAMDALVMRLYGNYGSVWDDYEQDFILCESCVLSLKGLFSAVGQSLLRWERADDPRQEGY